MFQQVTDQADHPQLPVSFIYQLSRSHLLKYDIESFIRIFAKQASMKTTDFVL